jgi:2-oxoglutarate ferredoxin oxidoreductase subunit delta
MGFEVHVNKERCKGCELCVSVCPKAVLGMSAKMNACGYHFPDVLKPRDCIGCARCALVCPDAAIEIYREDD